MTTLIVDTRERAVIPFIEEELKNHEYQLKQINTADFLICRKSDEKVKILAAIERKTHIDFASSFKDGRYANLNKMLSLREKTNCQLYFIIEGNAFPSPNRKFAGIPFNNILMSITKMMVHHGIFVIQTENEAYSAKRIVDLINMFDTIEEPYVPNNEEKCEIDCLELTTRIELRDDESIVNVWSCLNGISIVTAKILSNTFSINELVNVIDEKKIDSLKTLTGRPLHKNAIISLNKIRQNDIETSVKLLSGIKNISSITIRQVLTHTEGLKNLCSLSIENMSEIPIIQTSRTVKFGNAKSAKLINMLNYKKN